MRSGLVACVLAACSAGHPANPPDAAGEPGDGGTLGLPPPIVASDFDHPLDRASIRALQTWIDDATFDLKWSAMLTSPIALLGGADSAFHADLASRRAPLPGGEAPCHGDAKLDNFGWISVDGHGVFSDVDFDDAGPCPVAADALHFLVSTDLFFASSTLDEQGLAAYVDTVTSPDRMVAIDPACEPAWDALRTDGIDKATSHGSLILAGDVHAASSAEVAAVTALVAADARFPQSVLDVARVVRTSGGSAGLRRFWVLAEDAQHPRTIIELKELSPPGTEFGPHTATFDGPDRFDLLKAYWWDTPGPGDHFGVILLGARFVARDRFTRTTVSPSGPTDASLVNAVQAEASLMARKHRAAWHDVDPDQLRSWLRDSAAAVTARWRATYAAAGGT